MKKLVVQFIVCSMLSFQLLAQDIYTIKRGDILTTLVVRRFPHDKLYGSDGKLAEVLNINTHIKVPDQIYPGQKIQFSKTPEIENVQTDDQVVIIPEENKTEEVEKWDIFVLGGAKYYSVRQTGVLGSAQVDAVFLNDFKIGSKFHYKDWSFGFQVDSYKFKYDAPTSGDGKRMSSLNFFSSYKWFFGGVGAEQNPLFRNNGGSIEMVRMGLMSFVIGAVKDIEFPTKKPTNLSLRGLVKHPLTSSTDSSDVKLSSVNGLALNGQVVMEREILAKQEYSIHAIWMTQARFQNVTQSVNWGVSNGRIKSTYMEASTALGLLLRF